MPRGAGLPPEKWYVRNVGLTTFFEAWSDGKEASQIRIH